MRLKSLLFCFVLISCKLSCLGQEGWPSPELEQMYNHIQKYKQLGNYKDATSTLKQLINLVPGKTNLKTELGNLYYLAGDYEHGEETLAARLKEPAATDTTYQLLAACQLALGKNKQAIKTTEAGLQAFPNSGMLYYRAGLAYLQLGNKKKAGSSWEAGITYDPAFELNYKEYAILALHQKNADFMALQHAEEYLAMRADTTGNDSIKLFLYNGWKYFLSSLTDYCPVVTPPNGGKTLNRVYWELMPVVSDGVTTENLIMLRVRYVMAAMKRSHPEHWGMLLLYQDYLIRNGWFDIYNEWLFGRAEHEGEFLAWSNFHLGDMKRFEEWRVTHLLKTPGAWYGNISYDK